MCVCVCVCVCVCECVHVCACVCVCVVCSHQCDAITPDIRSLVILCPQLHRVDSLWLQGGGREGGREYILRRINH